MARTVSNALKRRHVGVRDVARLAGVSVASVSRTLTGEAGRVSEKTQTKVRDAALALGFVPNALAKGLSKSRTETIGVIMPNMNAHYARVASGIEEVAAERGLSILFCRTAHRDGQRDAALKLLAAHQVDGVIVCAGVADGPVMLPSIEGRVPIVTLGQIPGSELPSVAIDNAEAGSALAAHLLDLGHRSITFLTGPDNWWDGESRLAGFKRKLASRGLAPRAVLRGGYPPESAYELTRLHLKEASAPTALVCATDRLAVGAIAAALDLGFTIPDMLSVAGFDNFEASTFSRPSLTSMTMPGREMGLIGMRHLLALMDGEVPPDTHEPLHASLVVRGSSGPNRR